MISQKRLMEVIDYDQSTGLMKWKIATSNRAAVGERAGWASLGYIRIRIDGATYMAHRLAWLYVFGSWPENHIDHINGTRSDNRIENLREATYSMNIQNQRKAQPHNKLGILGVYFDSVTGRYKAQIRINGKQTHLGRFNSASEAHAAYVAAKRKFHEGCTL